MSNAIPITPVLDLLNQLVGAVFGGSIASEKPRTVLAATSIDIQPVMVDIGFGGQEASVNSTQEKHQYKIIIRQPIPPATGNKDLTIAKIKQANANALRGAIQVLGPWNGIANYPMITKVTWPDTDPLYEGTIETVVMFSCETKTSFY